MSSYVVTLTRPAQVQEGIQWLLDELAAWLASAMPSHLQQDWQGIHDEGTFLTAWAGYYAYTQDARVPELAGNLFGKWRRWAQEHFVHGYHPRQEVHHGTEHFLIFLDWLHRIDPANEPVQAALEDGAHHVGNWADDAPAWFDWDRQRYVSYNLGTREVGTEGFNFVDHLRLLHLAMAAWRASGQPRYLDLCAQYGAVWAAAVRDQPAPPLYLDATRDSAKTFASLLGTFLKAAPQDVSPFARLENHVASGGPKLWLEIWDATGADIFLHAAKRLGQGCAAHVTSPIANPAGHAVSQLIQAGLDPEELGVSQGTFTQMEPWPHLHARQLSLCRPAAPSGRNSIGFRHDMPAYFIDDAGAASPLRVPAPANLMLAWTLTGNEEYALDACCLALGKLQLSRQAFRDGRHHGCTAQSVAATVRGHGRCWGIGDVSGVLAHIGAQRAYRAAGHRLRDSHFPGLVTN